MRVKLTANWFAPTEIVKVDKIRSMGGQRFKKGEHEFPDEWKDVLPKSAIILVGPVEKESPVPNKEPSLKDFDQDRAASNETQRVNNEVHDRLKKAGRPKK